MAGHDNYCRRVAQSTAEQSLRFSAIGATEGFVHFQDKANVVTGCVCNRLFDLSEGEHNMRWLLYDWMARTQQVIDL